MTSKEDQRVFAHFLREMPASFLDSRIFATSPILFENAEWRLIMTGLRYHGSARQIYYTYEVQHETIITCCVMMSIEWAESEAPFIVEKIFRKALIYAEGDAKHRAGKLWIAPNGQTLDEVFVDVEAVGVKIEVGGIERNSLFEFFAVIVAWCYSNGKFCDSQTMPNFVPTTIQRI
ncbi:hypothetical protein EJ08DRAFT_723015 [Tothia fuscella]|uniref:Uncharacterized protein n=1 Tax=Tothia fuscella TaxID=1048955 RepID=A0A9P4TVL9_9PEZI|nr:hypothetical protein EJ08DRAFT_723015 [Tothia fuscella]